MRHPAADLVSVVPHDKKDENLHTPRRAAAPVAAVRESAVRESAGAGSRSSSATAMPSAERTAQTVAAASHPLTNCAADGRADVGTARETTIAMPAAPPRYLAVLFAPLPSPGWPGGADDTASCPSAAFAKPVPTPVTRMPGSSPDQPPAGDSCPSHSSSSRQIARPSASRCRVITRLGMRCACQATTALVVDHVASSAELATADQPSARSRKLGA
jgi:hypothetical protein